MNVQHLIRPGVKVTVAGGARNRLRTGFKDISMSPYCEGDVGYTHYAIAVEVPGDPAAFKLTDFETKLREVMMYDGWMQFEVIELWSDE